MARKSAIGNLWGRTDDDDALVVTVESGLQAVYRSRPVPRSSWRLPPPAEDWSFRITVVMMSTSARRESARQQV